MSINITNNHPKSPNDKADLPRQPENSPEHADAQAVRSSVLLGDSLKLDNNQTRRLLNGLYALEHAIGECMANAEIDKYTFPVVSLQIPMKTLLNSIKQFNTDEVIR
jgi:hypothetical protein